MKYQVPDHYVEESDEVTVYGNCERCGFEYSETVDLVNNEYELECPDCQKVIRGRVDE